MTTVTRDAFVAFIRSSMGIPSEALPDDSRDIDLAYQLASDTIIDPVCLPASVYVLAFLNLAAAYLVEYASDQPNSQTFEALRKKFGLNNLSVGIVQSAADQGTSAAMLVPDWVKDANLFQMQLLKTPWGRIYLELAQRLSPAWGMV